MPGRTVSETDYRAMARELIACVGVAEVTEEAIAAWAAVARVNADCLATAVSAELDEFVEQLGRRLRRTP